jgi:hypothetical protein
MPKLRVGEASAMAPQREIVAAMAPWMGYQYPARSYQ